MTGKGEGGNGGGVEVTLGAVHGEIPAASAGMTDLGARVWRKWGGYGGVGVGWGVWRLRSLTGRRLRRGFGRRWRSRRSGCWSMGCCRSWGCCWWGMIRRRRRMCGVRSGLGRRRGSGCGSCALRRRVWVRVGRLRGMDQVGVERLRGMDQVRVGRLRERDQVGVERLRGMDQVRVGRLRGKDSVRVARLRERDRVRVGRLRGKDSVRVERRLWRRGLGRRLMR